MSARRRISSAPIGALACALTVSLATLAAAAPVRSLELALDPEPGITRVRFDVGTGDIALRPSPDGRVRARLELTAQPIDFKVVRWSSASAEALVDGASVARVRDGDLLVIYVAFPAPAGDKVHETWEVEVPDSLLGLVRVNVGNADVRGLRQGVAVEINVGDAHLTLGIGNATARVNLGRIEAEAAGRSYAHALLSANLGDVHAEIEGRDLANDPAPPPTARLDLAGEGEAVHRLEVNVGSVRYSVRRP